MTKTNHLLMMSSGNAKLGPNVVSTYAPRNTCPPACSLKDDNGCYAESIRTRKVWDATEDARNAPAHALHLDIPSIAVILDGLLPATLFRHAVAGDLPGLGNKLDILDFNTLRRACEVAELRGWTYTHKPLAHAAERRAVRRSNENAKVNCTGLTVNRSADSLAEADAYVRQGFPTVVLLPPDTSQRVVMTPAGNRVVVCPNSLNSTATCSTCGGSTPKNARPLCQRAERDFIVGFPVHGQYRGRAELVRIGKGKVAA